MPFMQWHNTFELGIKEFDDHHKHLVDLLNKVYDDFTNGANHEALGAVFGDLIAYASYHFAAEESWMQKYKYPGFNWHLKEHDELRAKALKLQKDYADGKEKISVDVLMFLVEWLSEHILISDAQYGKFARGLSHEVH